MTEEKKKDDSLRVHSSPPFKLKDRPGRIWRSIGLKAQFGFVPEIIIVEKVRGKNNTIIVRAVLTKEEMVKEDEQRALAKKLEIKKKGGDKKNG